MKSTSATILAIGASIASQAAASTLYVDNLCKFPVYLRSGTGNAQPSQVYTLTPNTTNAYHETMRPPPAVYNYLSVGVTPSLPHPMQVGYTQSNQGAAPGTTYYDLSTVYGDSFAPYGFELLSGGNGYSIKCSPRTNGGNCPNTYNPQNPNGNGALFTQGNQYNLVLRLCASN